MFFIPPPSSPLQAAYEQVLHPKLAQVATVENVVFDWESLHFVLKRGQLALAAPIQGRVITAVFTGTAELDVTPPNAIEAQQIKFFTGRPAIAEPFTQAVFRFADGKIFTNALADQVHFHPIGANAGATGDFDGILNARAATIEKDGLEEGVRMLLALDADIRLPIADRLLYAELHSADHGWIEAADDPMSPAPIRVHAWAERAIYRAEPRGFLRNTDFSGGAVPWEDPTNIAGMPISEGFDNTWAQFATPDAAPPPPWRITEYKLALNLPRRIFDYLEGRELKFTTDAALAVTWSPGSLVLLRLDPRLRLHAITADGQPVGWLQPAAPAPTPPPRVVDAGVGNEPSPDYEGDWALLRMPRALLPGDRVALHFEYQPADDNDLDYLLHAPRWYPQPAFAPPVERSMFDFTAESDPSVRVIAAGNPTRNQRVGDMQVTEWASTIPVPGLGFALRPKILDSDQPTSTTVTLADGRAVKVSEQEKKQSVLDLAANALRFFDHTFGSYPYETLELSEAAETWLWQTPEYRSPSPPSMRGRAGRGFSAAVNAAQKLEYLIAVDPLSGLPNRQISPTGPSASRPGGHDEPAWPAMAEISPLSTWDNTLLHSIVTHVDPDSPPPPPKHLSPAATDRLLTLSPAQSVARQWFGVEIGWAAPGDRWLADGFATAAALLFAQKSQGKDGNAMVLNTLRQWQTDLLGTDAYGHIPNDDGALALGPRLGSSRDPLGYEIVDFEKGAYVLYMLRQMMANPDRGEPDDAFIAMMHEYTATWAGRNPSTADFERLANRFMTPNMDFGRNHRLDWFFEQYVRGTLVPQLWVHPSVTAAADGKWQVHLEVDNPDGWRGVLPIDLMKSATDSQRGWVRIAGPKVETSFSVAFQPTAVVANRYEDMLVRIMNPDAK